MEIRLKPLVGDRSTVGAGRGCDVTDSGIYTATRTSQEKITEKQEVTRNFKKLDLNKYKYQDLYAESGVVCRYMITLVYSLYRGDEMSRAKCTSSKVRDSECWVDYLIEPSSRTVIVRKEIYWSQCPFF